MANLSKRKGYIAPRLGLGGCNKPMIFWRSQIPVVKRETTYQGQPCEVLEGSAQVAENLQIKITVKRDEFTADDGTQIVYRVSLMGFDMDSNKSNGAKNGNGLKVVRAGGNSY